MPRDGLSDLEESSRSATLSGASQKLNSDTSGSIDREKTANTNGKDNDCSSGNDNVISEKPCPYISQHDAQFHIIQRHGVSSCPELCQILGDFKELPSRREIQDIPKRVDKPRPEVDKSRYWYHLRVRDIILERFRSLRRRIKRSGSSTFSIRSEFPPPLNRKVRRLLARDSVDIWPSSGEESPVFNTPESDAPNVKRTSGTGSHIDPLAMASMMIATAELDRLSSRMSLDQASGVSGSSVGISQSSRGSHTSCDKDITTPNNEMSASVSTVLDMPPAVPFNTPSSSVPHSGTISPVSKSPQRRGQRRKTQRSRLSEVTTPDEIASLAESVEELNDSLSLPDNPIETLPECSGVSRLGDEDLYPKPLIINRTGQDEANVGVGNSSGYSQEQFPSFEPPEPHILSVDLKRELGTSSQLPGSIHLDIEDIITASVSSVSGTARSYEPLEMSRTTDEPSLPDVSLGLEFTFMIPAISSDLTVSVTSRETCGIQSDPIANMKGGTPAMEAKIDYVSESQGEPGDSEPFCPPDCLTTRRSSRDSLPQPLMVARQDKDETVQKLEEDEVAVLIEGSCSNIAG
ncbi:uncharacterized protein F4812DRAFT_458807 [Daldinia caldariorum]|uniref:uncharacterized protein n=1 Tax=Daldinia caldariorum TaxID=326644 RepID=UPI002008C3FE|nr:uncharacterized protein F4812DRAFT_458807 [Daldinia caldariorum]KAI1468371.1 hypothetical protein F4812DRAFT_458807 [Daldinia caldariorum]